MKSKIFIALVIGLITSLSGVHANPDPPIEGKTIFTNRCASCHNVNKELTGPALAGVDERRSIDWIINFVHSSQTMVKKGDKDAVALFEKFNRIPMPDHRDLTEEDIKGIVEFIKSEAKPAEESSAPFAKPGKKQLPYQPLSITKHYGFFISYFIALGLLIGALLFAVHVSNLKAEKSKS